MSQSFFPLLSITVHVFDYVKNINIVKDINGDAEDVKDSWMANFLFSLARLGFNNDAILDEIASRVNEAS